MIPLRALSRLDDWSAALERAGVRAPTTEQSAAIWTPNPCRGCGSVDGGCDLCQHTGLGPQGAFMRIDTDILGYGGAAGGGKTSSAAVKAALRWGDRKGFSGILFRRTSPEAIKSLWKEVLAHYGTIQPGTRLTTKPLLASLPAGGSVEIGYLDHPGDRDRYQGGEYQYVAFDEASHFHEADVRYLFTRQRSTQGIPSQLVLCMNPPAASHPGRQWLFRWFAPWVDPDFPSPAASREVRYFLAAHDGRGDAVFQWFRDDGGLVQADDPGARSITFIAALLEDNQALMANDPTYEARLALTDKVTHQQLRFGDWLIKPVGGGKIHSFNREWHMPLGGFARRMGCSSLREAIAIAIRLGWKVTTGWDHGQSAGREVCVIIIHNDQIQEAWVVGVYINEHRTVPKQDALAVRRLIDARGIPMRAIVRSVGDVGNLGKGSTTDSGSLAATINKELSTCLGPDGRPILGFPIHVPQKEGGSVDKGVELLNMTLESGGWYFDECTGDLATAIESWTGGEAYKDPCDAWRYPAREIIEGWLNQRPGMSGTSGG